MVAQADELSAKCHVDMLYYPVGLLDGQETSRSCSGYHFPDCQVLPSDYVWLPDKDDPSLGAAKG